MACPSRTERAENGAGYSFRAFHRESLKEATQANQPPSPAHIVRIGFPILGGKRENTEGTSGEPRSRVGWEGKAKDVLAICPSLGVVLFPYPWATVVGPSSPVGPVLVQPTPLGHSSSLLAQAMPAFQKPAARPLSLRHCGASRSPRVAQRLWACHLEDNG